MDKPFIPLNCFFQGCYNPEFEREIEKCKLKCFEYNNTSPDNKQRQQEILKELIGSMGEDAILTPPIYLDYGYRIKVGKSFFANHNLVIQDGGGVSFGDNVFIGPNCCFTTAEHAIDPEMRKQGVEIAKPISIGNNVWIGAGSTILAGVTIGDNTVIGAGSVVTKDIPPMSVACGVPCKVKRKICEADKYTYPTFEG